MKIDRSTLLRRLRAAPGWVAAVLLAVGCGGGVGTGGTGGYAQGSISGFGSVIVNDVHYDDTRALVLDVDGNTRSRDDLRLGMTVEIDSGAVGDSGSGPSASASRIRYASELVGAVATIDLVNQRLTLLGQTVQVLATTVFDDALAGGLAVLLPDQVLEVYADFDPANQRYKATRIELRGSGGNYRLRGVIGQLDTGTRRLVIGNAEFEYAAGTTLPAGLAAGSFVRLQIQPAAANSSRWTVVSLASATPAPGDGLQAKVKGLISAFTSSSAFFVNGQRVDASGASFPNGSAGLALGVRVEIEGRMQAGVLQATKVSIETDDDEQAHGFDLRGAITSIDKTAKTFVLRGVVVRYGGTVEYRNGTEAQLDVNQRIEVKGMLAAGGNTLQATRIEFDN